MLGMCPSQQMRLAQGILQSLVVKSNSIEGEFADVVSYQTTSSWKSRQGIRPWVISLADLSNAFFNHILDLSNLNPEVWWGKLHDPFFMKLWLLSDNHDPHCGYFQLNALCKAISIPEIRWLTVLMRCQMKGTTLCLLLRVHLQPQDEDTELLTFHIDLDFTYFELINWLQILCFPKDKLKI